MLPNDIGDLAAYLSEPYATYVQRLKANQRQAVLLSVAGYDQAEIASILEFSQQHVSRLLTSAYLELRRLERQRRSIAKLKTLLNGVKLGLRGTYLYRGRVSPFETSQAVGLLQIKEIVK